MADPLEALFYETGLLKAILHSEPLDEFPAQTVRRATEYLAPGIVTDPAAKVDVGDSIVVSAKVSGSSRKPYSTEIEFFFDDESGWHADYFCNCPVSWHCKHSVALMIRLKEIVKQRLSGTGKQGPIVPRDVGEWLKQMEASLAGSGPHSKSQPRKPASQKVLAYCLEDSSFGGKMTCFTLHPASILKNGKARIDRAHTRMDLNKPPKYIADEDLPVCIAWQRHPTTFDGWSYQVMPEGPEGMRLIEMARATGRLYYFNSRSPGGIAPLGQGPPLTVELKWEQMPSGNARPVIDGIPAGVRILHVEPPMYFDPQEEMVGPLECAQPAQMLKHWSAGPEIAANLVEHVSTRIGSIAGSDIPVPHAVSTEIRPACPPTPHFTVTRLSASLAGRPDRFTVGQLSFRYGDSPLLPHVIEDEAPAHHVVMNDDKRIVWKRDAGEERALAIKLISAGLIPFREVLSEHLLHHTLRSTHVPADPQPSTALAWLRCIESPAMQDLRDEGWVITIDPKAGLTAHDVTEFLPAIERENDKGIDWFQFDMSFEADGVKRSLIPLIAQAIAKDYPPSTKPDLPEWITISCENPEEGFIRLPARRFLEIVDQVRHLFLGRKAGDGPLKIDRLAAAGLADSLGVQSSATSRALAELGRSLKDIRELPQEEIPSAVKASLRPYQHEGFRWLRFLAKHHLNGILADDMGLGKTVQALAYLAAEHSAMPGKPSLVVAPTSVVPNWESEAAKFTPQLRVLVHHGNERSAAVDDISSADLVVTSYPLLHRDIGILAETEWHSVILDEAQYIKNPKSITAQAACALTAAHRLCLSGTPMENHLGELWSLMRFLMPGYLPDEKTFNSAIRKPIERDRSGTAQLALNRRVSPLILRRTKDQVAPDLPPKTELVHHIELTRKQIDLYESVRASMDVRVREAIAAKGLAKSHIIVLDALLKLRQICCHPSLLNSPAAEKVTESAKLHFLTDELLPQLIEEGRRILLFSQFTSMLALIEAHLEKHDIPYLKLTGQTRDRASLVKKFQSGQVPVFLISLKAGGTGLNLTAADTVIHYDPWWNPAAENQATDRAHRIGQNKPVFVHKLVCRGSIEDRILDLQKHKSALVKALLSEETTSLRIDSETLSHLLSPIA